MIESTFKTQTDEHSAQFDDFDDTNYVHLNSYHKLDENSIAISSNQRKNQIDADFDMVAF